MSDLINYCIASIPSRMHSLKLIMNSIINQADRIYVYLNGYKYLPPFLNHKKITVYTSIENGDMGDIGKFYAVAHCKGYIFTIDDDILYPKNYSEMMIEKIEQYKRKALICVHGNKLPNTRLKSYYKEKIGLHFAKSLATDTLVDVPGTGTMAYHSSLCRLSLDYFKKKNMTDIWLYKYARENKIPVICIERASSWLRPITESLNNNSIYAKYHNKDTFQTNIINKFYCRGD